MFDDFVRHLARPALPWRASPLTRCGCLIAELSEGSIVSLAQAKKLVKNRQADQVCLSCLQHANDWPEWGFNPGGLMHQYTRKGAWGAARDGWLTDDLRAIAALIEAHRDEFDALVESKAKR